MLKSIIRKKILKIRRNRSNKKINIQFDHIYNFLKSITNLRKKIIGGYYPVDFEVDDLKVLRKFEEKKIKISLPVIKKNFKMNFIQCSLNEPFIINQYGIPEPIGKKKVYPDIFLIPLVAFDKNFNRLGYGGGFYDRFIQSIKKSKKVTTIGLAFDFQEVPSIPASRHDQKLDYIITNKKILK